MVMADRMGSRRVKSLGCPSPSFDGRAKPVPATDRATTMNAGFIVETDSRRHSKLERVEE